MRGGEDERVRRGEGKKVRGRGCEGKDERVRR